MDHRRLQVAAHQALRIQVMHHNEAANQTTVKMYQTR